MSESTAKLHRILIQAIRGMLNAWENWLKEQTIK